MFLQVHSRCKLILQLLQLAVELRLHASKALSLQHHASSTTMSASGSFRHIQAHSLASLRQQETRSYCLWLFTGASPSSPWHSLIRTAFKQRDIMRRLHPGMRLSNSSWRCNPARTKLQQAKHL
jgi:hypothetical protein